MARKTIQVDTLRDKVNEMLRAPDGSREGRVALTVLIESVLVDTGNYHGFQYLTSEWLPEEYRDYASGKMLKPDHDDTRRFYY